MAFPEVNARPRINEGFKQSVDEEHFHNQSPLLNSNMVRVFRHDYMHLVCLVLMRHPLDLWMGSSGPLRCRISSCQAFSISETLVTLREYIPMEFARKPFPLSDRLRWKATELHHFLFCTGPLVLKDELQSPVYDNFMLLSVGVYLLASPEYCFTMNDLANTLLVSFVHHFGQLYGQESSFITYMA